MDKYKIKSIFKKINNDHIIKVKVPGSKSITNRALLIAALAKGESRLKGALFSNDAKNMIACLNTLGIKIDVNEEDELITVHGCGGMLPVKNANINVGSAGTAARFITAMLAFSSGVYHLDASEQMKKRPMKPLLDALINLGVIISYDEKEGHFPFALDSREVKGGKISLSTAISSQFLSAVIMTGFLLENGLRVDISGGRESLPYVDMTVKVMEDFGLTVNKVDEDGLISYILKEGNSYEAREYDIEPDVSAACYFYAMAEILGCKAQVQGVYLDSIQGDIEFVKLLTKMGAVLSEEKDGIIIQGAINGEYEGIEANLNSFSDQALTLAAISVFAKTPTKITGVAHIRLQESDRLLAMKKELEKLGIRTEMGEGEITIFPNSMDGADVEIETYEDHRVAMAFSLIGLRRNGIVIENPECSAKTFKDYFQILDGITSILSL
ncbi:MAG: 3-phosphoshikimate 1-carboxyvinyltransferase [Catonella sp.]|uniref:3-phosphoshikimate 1-carboxyvinyltransferase n=1 Tax=Catonella sp. TaxID=2382125 RepID=UPI003F9EDD10